jgi:flavin-binding protein dodecin
MEQPSCQPFRTTSENECKGTVEAFCLRPVTRPHPWNSAFESILGGTRLALPVGMAFHVYKHIKVTGQSTESIEAAIRAALKESAHSIKGHSWFEVVEVRGNLGPGAEIQSYQVTLEVGFAIERA